MNKDHDQFLFLGCDGVFELLKNQEIVDYVRHFELLSKHLPNCYQVELLILCSVAKTNSAYFPIKLAPIKFPDLRGAEDQECDERG
jgi:hypothetical protein